MKRVKKQCSAPSARKENEIMSVDQEPATGPAATSAASSPASDVSYHVADLPREEVEKLQRLEEELRADTGEEVIVIAYEKEPSGRSRATDTP
jgi:hypothetical protein